MPSPEIRAERGPTGLALWRLPYSNLSILWAGPGARLRLVQNIAGGLDTLIEADGSNDSYATFAEARAAAARFIASLETNTLPEDDEEWTNREGMPEYNGSFR